jgi:hypothetical protein
MSKIVRTKGRVNIYSGIPGKDINPVLIHEVEQFKIGDFGYYIIDNEYMYIFCNNKDISIYLCDHTIIKDEKLLRMIKIVITKYVHNRLMEIIEVIKNGSEII